MVYSGKIFPSQLGLETPPQVHPELCLLGESKYSQVDDDNDSVGPDNRERLGIAREPILRERWGSNNTKKHRPIQDREGVGQWWKTEGPGLRSLEKLLHSLDGGHSRLSLT